MMSGLRDFHLAKPVITSTTVKKIWVFSLLSGFLSAWTRLPNTLDHHELIACIKPRSGIN